MTYCWPRGCQGARLHLLCYDFVGISLELDIHKIGGVFVVPQKILGANSVLSWIEGLAHYGRLDVLVYSSKSLHSYVRHHRARGSTTNQLTHRIQDFELLEGWSADFLRILGKFANPERCRTQYNSRFHHFAPRSQFYIDNASGIHRWLLPSVLRVYRMTSATTVSQSCPWAWSRKP